MSSFRINYTSLHDHMLGWSGCASENDISHKVLSSVTLVGRNLELGRQIPMDASHSNYLIMRPPVVERNVYILVPDR